MMRWREVVGLVVLAGALAACGGEAGSGGSVGETSASAPSATAPPSSEEELGPPTDNAPRSGDGAASPGAAAQLVDVRTGRHRQFDRVVFEFTGSRPGYDVEYVPELRSPGSGRPVDLSGAQTLEVTLRGVARAPQGSESPGLTPDLPQVEQVRYLGSFEDIGTAGIGISASRQPNFRVLTLTSPPRIAIDIAHTANGGGDRFPPATLKFKVDTRPGFDASGVTFFGLYRENVNDSASVPLPNEADYQAVRLRDSDGDGTYLGRTTVDLQTADNGRYLAVIFVDENAAPGDVLQPPYNIPLGTASQAAHAVGLAAGQVQTVSPVPCYPPPRMSRPDCPES